MHRLAALLLALFVLAPPAFGASNVVNGILTYRGFTIDMTLVDKAPNRDAIEASLKKQIDTVADSGVKPEIMAFWRKQKISLEFGSKDGGGNAGPNGIHIDAAPQPPEKPILLHELLHALHGRYMPNGSNNADIEKFYNRAVERQAYPQGEYVLKNKGEFFAVTASLYLSGYVARPPNDRETLRAKQPVYYVWLGDLFGVKK
jgi:hypothetical protein